MKKYIAAGLLFLSVELFSQGTETARSFLDKAAGINFAYNAIACKLGDNERENTFNLLYGTAEFDLEIFENLVVGLMAGYKISFLKNDVDFNQLPLTLRLDRANSRYSGPLVGATVQYTPFSFGDFAFKARGDFLYSLRGTREWPVTLAAVAGTATIQENFFLATADLLFQYEGFSGFTVFAGGRLNRFLGKYKASQSIAELSGAEEMSIKQKNLAGPVAGVIFELGSSWEVTFRASLLSRFSAALDIHYTF